ncbi:MAG: hypothetical protein JXR31_15930, partial [Prolixibacteraceae bacterium]|nr:hypothetical protein [Prolixibacteraceae bacterium]MBN2775745.1 hypothetical protein [Prolixibacteraceae bacterium]
MKISKLTKLAWVFFALTLATTTVFAQARGFRNRVNVNPNVNNGGMSCIDMISDLSADQKSAIVELENKHQEEMSLLRAERRSTIDLQEKNLIRQEMLETVANHQNEVMALLDNGQKEQYQAIQAQGTLHKYQNPYGRGIYGRVAPGDTLLQEGVYYQGSNNFYRRGAGRGAYGQGQGVYGRGPCGRGLNRNIRGNGRGSRY